MTQQTNDFEQYRQTLFGLAYRLLGSAMDAEDIVQDAYLRYQKAIQVQDIDTPKAFLRRTVTNLCLDYLKSARVQREEYTGTWLPEPILTDDNSAFTHPVKSAEIAESISMAFMVMLEKLSAPERAVLILRGVFDYDYGEIATILNRSEASCRQLYSRAKKHVDAHKIRYEKSPEHHAALVGQFLQAMASGNLQGLKTMLAEDVALYSDGGGKVPAATRPLFGQERVAAFLNGLYRRGEQMNLTYEVSLHTINDETGIVLRDETGQIFTAAILEINDDKVQAVRFIRNPDKLKMLATSID